MWTRRHVRRLLMFGLCFGVLTLGMGRSADAQTFSVTNISDTGTGSLRQAIADANAAGGGTIEFGLTGCPCTIELTSGELFIERNLTINGPGPSLLTVRSNGTSRVFRIALDVTAVLDGFQVRNGNGIGGWSSSAGGGILNEGTLTLLNMIVAENTSSHSGGGVYSSRLQGALTVRHSVFSGNQSAYGGAIRTEGSLLMFDSTVVGNAANGGSGGGVFVENATIVGSTIAGNTATGPGGSGGGFHHSEGHLTIVNSTISGNSAAAGGGGFTQFGTLTLYQTTVTANNATSDDSGGLKGTDPFATLVLNNSIVAGNFSQDVDGFASVTNNSSLIGGDVGLLSLANNGGPTETHALAANSPAIGAGDNALVPADTLDLDNDGNTTEPVPVDQRGLGFPRLAGFNVDIGAVEAVCAAIVLTRTPQPAPPSVGVPYTETFDANGGAGPYSFAATGLPGGLTLSTTGVLSGTSTESGTFTVTVTVTDAYGCGGTLTFTLTIADPSCGIVIGPATLKTPYLATLYYQPLSVTPSGQYAVTVSAGALPPGVYLFAIGRNWYLGGIPSAPGTYTFTLAATKANSPCAPTRTYTVIVPATVLPQLTCVAKTGAKQYTARFGYDNSTEAAVTIPVGADNYFTPGAQDRGQVTTFQKGRVTNAFSVVFTVKNNNTDLALWYLRGPDDVRRPVNITTATSRCP